MPKTKVEVYDKNQLIYPFIESDHVTFSNGMKVTEMLDQSISMPTVTHEDLSFKVGVGDQDVSSAIVDSSVAEMTIKGKTYQNILPEPSTHVLTNNKEMFKVNEGLDPNVEIVDAVSKSAILSGQTKYMYQGVVQDTFAHIVKFVSGQYLDPKTGQLMDGQGTHVNCDQYFKIPSGATTIVSKGNNTYKKLCLYDSDKNYIVGDGKADGGDSTSDIVRQIPSNARYFRFSTNRDKTKDERCYIYIDGVLVATSDVDIECGLTSCKMPVLKTNGKNLFDGKFTFGEIAGGVDNNETKFAKSINYIPVKPNTNYFLSCTDGYNSTNGRVIAWYDSNKKFITHINHKGISPINACYARIRTRKDNSTSMTESEVSTIQAQLEEATSATSYEPYKSNILSTPGEVVLRSLPNGVKDTLNLMTGEYVQRIGEITFNGSETWQESGNVAPNHYCAFTRVEGSKNVLSYNIMCNSLPVKNILSPTIDSEGCMFNEWASGDKANVVVKIANSKLSSTSVNGIKAYLQSNPLTVQYELATPIIKTVDLSSSGNWEKVVLDGSGTYVRNGSVSNDRISVFHYRLLNGLDDGSHVSFICDGLKIENSNNPYTIYKYTNTTELVLQFPTQVVSTLEQLKAHLSQNPITVWYQTAIHQDSTQVKQPIFFKDGHIIQSSGADNSLVPTLDYQAKTSNSYVMDLMKANTRYTMKAKSASGTFTIDGTSYGAGTNGTFTSPTSMTNKLLVMSNKTNEEVMILEGDVVSKTIPYFKGIKSAFEGEDKIEVLSTGKNLYPYGDSTYIPEYNGWYFVNGDRQTRWGESVHKDCGQGAWFYLDEGRYYFSVVNNNNVQTLQVIGDKEQLYGDGKLIPSGWYTLRMSVKNANEEVNITNIMVEKDTKTTYEPYKSNNTKIPLLSSLQTVVENVHMTQGSLDNATGAELVDTTCVRSDFIEVVEDTTIVFRNGGLDRMAHILAYDSEKRYVEKLGIVSSCSIPKDRGIKYVRIFMNMSNYDKLKISKSVKAYKGLASLPNGVHDEIILDRENNKAKIIQRVGEITYDGADVWGTYTVHQNNVRIQTTLPNCVRRDTADFIYAICDKLPSVIWNHSWLQNYNLVAVNHANIHLQLSDTTMTKRQMLSWLTQNPLTVYYELETPIITEIDLEGFPYIYKDGHIFLNSEIASTTEIIYSINQCQQISASNEDIIRHEKELTYLQKLIAQYVQVDYESVLLSLKV